MFKWNVFSTFTFNFSIFTCKIFFYITFVIMSFLYNFYLWLSHGIFSSLTFNIIFYIILFKHPLFIFGFYLFQLLFIHFSFLLWDKSYIFCILFLLLFLIFKCMSLCHYFGDLSRAVLSKTTSFKMEIIYIFSMKYGSCYTYVVI